jgi:hypothetical protein
MEKREKRREEGREREILGKLRRGGEGFKVRVIGEFEIDFGFGAKSLSIFKYEVQVGHLKRGN